MKQKVLKCERCGYKDYKSKFLLTGNKIKCPECGETCLDYFLHFQYDRDVGENGFGKLIIQGQYNSSKKNIRKHKRIET